MNSSVILLNLLRIALGNVYIKTTAMYKHSSSLERFLML